MAIITETPVVGGVTSNEAKIHVRTDAAATVKISYVADFSLSDVLQTDTYTTHVLNDFTVIIPLVGLLPGTLYYYGVAVVDEDEDEDFPSETSVFTTFSDDSNEFKFGVFADAGDSDNPSRAYKSGNLDDILFAMQIGDLNHSNPQTLDDMRALHREMRDPEEVHGGWFTQWITSKMALAHVWDDHDYYNNDADKTAPGRLAALQAFREYYPTHTLPGAGIWHSFACGDAEFFMLDVRSERDPNTIPDNPGKSMLGAVQKQWLKYSLLSSTHMRKFIISPVSFNKDARPKSTDLWHNFAYEAVELGAYIGYNEITGVVVISGDLHTGGGIDSGANSLIGLPEMTVPHTSLVGGNRRNKGTWDIGVTDGARGYGLVTVSDTGGVTLAAKAANGSVRHTYTL